MTMTISAPRSRSPRRLRSIGIAAGAFALAGLGVAAVQEAARLGTRADLATSATFVDIGGRDIRLHCTGSGEQTYVLEAGATGFAETWTWVQDGLDDDARVCSYDRAGMGLSDPAAEGFDLERSAADLKAALDAAGETGPYILAGHSLGGLLVRDFAARYPEETAGLVLVDPSHEDQLAHFGPEMVEQFEAFPGVLSAISFASMTGLLHLYNPLEAGTAGLEGDALDAALAFAGDREHLDASAAELEAWDTITGQVRATELLADLPVLVVTAGAPVPGSEPFAHINEPLHQEIAGRFDVGTQTTLEEAHHFSILMNEAHAGELTGLIKHFVRTQIR